MEILFKSPTSSIKKSFKVEEVVVDGVGMTVHPYREKEDVNCSLDFVAPKLCGIDIGPVIAVHELNLVSADYHYIDFEFWNSIFRENMLLWVEAKTNAWNPLWWPCCFGVISQHNAMNSSEGWQYFIQLKGKHGTNAVK